MNRDPEAEDLAGWFAAMTDGRMAPEDRRRFEERLARDPEARRRWFLHCDLELGLAEWAALGREAVPAPSRATPGRRRGKRVGLLAAAGLAACGVLLAAGWWVGMVARRTAERPNSGVALLSRSVDARWADGRQRAPGESLEAGEFRLAAGAALVEFYSGARAVVEAPARFALVSADEAFLAEGRMRVRVPPQARGFTIGTERARVIDHGTEFAVAAGGTGEVHVFEGRVEVVGPRFAPRDLHGGEAVRLSGGLVAIPATAGAFLSEPALAERERRSAERRLEDWRRSADRLGRDAAAAAHFRFEAPGPGGTTLTNSIPGGAPGTLVGGAWVPGRWPAKGAVEFRGEGGRMRLGIPGPLQTVTLLAWVRVDSLERWQNVLLSADGERPGALRWHLTRRGELRLEIARDLGRSQADWEAVNSEPFLTAGRMGSWRMVATTFDGRRIRHYGDGEPIGEGASFTPPGLWLGGAEVANWSGDTQRQLDGAVDEFLILSRAATAAELKAYFEAGRP